MAAQSLQGGEKRLFEPDKVRQQMQLLAAMFAGDLGARDDFQRRSGRGGGASGSPLRVS